MIECHPPHTICPVDVPGRPGIEAKEVGGIDVKRQAQDIGK